MLTMFNRISGRLGAVILTVMAVVAVVGFMGVGAVNAQSFNRSIAWAATGKLLWADTTPTIASGFGSSPAVSSSNGSAVFRINVGSGGSATSGVVTLPTASAGWGCVVQDQTTNIATRQTNTSSTSVTVTAASAWTASDILVFLCAAY